MRFYEPSDLPIASARASIAKSKAQQPRNGEARGPTPYGGIAYCAFLERNLQE